VLPRNHSRPALAHQSNKHNQPQAPEDPSGAILTLVNGWRHQRIAALTAEVARLTGEIDAAVADPKEL
jgi:hypothetical protein